MRTFSAVAFLTLTICVETLRANVLQPTIPTPTTPPTTTMPTSTLKKQGAGLLTHLCYLRLGSEVAPARGCRLGSPVNNAKGISSTTILPFTSSQTTTTAKTTPQATTGALTGIEKTAGRQWQTRHRRFQVEMEDEQSPTTRYKRSSGWMKIMKTELSRLRALTKKLQSARGSTTPSTTASSTTTALPTTQRTKKTVAGFKSWLG